MKIFLILLVMCVFYTEITGEDERLPQYGRNLQDVETSIIDVPDDAPWPTRSNGFNNLGNHAWPRIPSDVNQNVGLNQYYPPTKEILSVVPKRNHSQNTNLQNYPNPYPYNAGAHPLPYNQYHNTPYVYRPFYPNEYIRHYYPSLHQQFPNGFYVLPETDSALTIPKTPIATKQASYVTTGGNLNNPERSNGNTTPNNNGKNEPTNLQISNNTLIAEKRTFVNRIELKPVMTKFVRYNGPDGKTYVKVTSSGAEGEEVVTESIHTGSIDLKILNGVLQKPKSSADNVSGASEKQSEVDPNSIVVQTNEKENQKPETGEPDDITSWIY